MSQTRFLGKGRARVGIQARWIPKSKPFAQYHTAFRDEVRPRLISLRAPNAKVLCKGNPQTGAQITESPKELAGGKVIMRSHCHLVAI